MQRRFGGTRLEDRPYFGGEYIIYVSTKEAPPARGPEPWNAVYKTHFVTGITKRLIHQKGHKARDCHKKQSDRKKNGKEVESKPVEARIIEFDDGVLLVSESNDRFRSDWVLDYGGSCHIYPHRDYFSTHNATEGRVVMTGDDTPYTVVGLGTIRFVMHDGVIRTLINNVKHVLGLKRNLISMDTLEDIGHKWWADFGTLHVYKGSTVVLKGHKWGSLYVLEGTLVKGIVAAVNSFDSLAPVVERVMSPKGVADLVERVHSKVKSFAFSVIESVVSSSKQAIFGHVHGGGMTGKSVLAKSMCSLGLVGVHEH